MELNVLIAVVCLSGILLIFYLYLVGNFFFISRLLKEDGVVRKSAIGST